MMQFLQAITVAASKENETLSAFFSRIGITNTLPYKWSGTKSRISTENLKKICMAFRDHSNAVDVLCGYLRDEVERAGISQDSILIINTAIQNETIENDPLFLELANHFAKDPTGKKREMLEALTVLWRDC